MLFREPLKPILPALDQPMAFPEASVTLTSVLLNVAVTWTMPRVTFFEPLAL